MTMKDQMEMQDMDGLTVLMHATRSGNVAIFQAVTRQICPTQVREMVPSIPTHQVSAQNKICLCTMQDLRNRSRLCQIPRSVAALRYIRVDAISVLFQIPARKPNFD